ncbi:MAG: D-aminoacyl-tRNA deacylase [Actinomycetes bacterium]
MRGLVQRVERAAVVVRAVDAHGRRTGAEEPVGQIGHGLCVLVGAGTGDDRATAQKLADKVWHLRVLEDAGGSMNLSLADRLAAGEPAEVLVVSQFTLYGDTRKGRRPSFVDAAPPDLAEPLVEAVVARLRELGATVATGRFRTDMAVSLVNDGPVTLLLEV